MFRALFSNGPDLSMPQIFHEQEAGSLGFSLTDVYELEFLFIFGEIFSQMETASRTCKLLRRLIQPLPGSQEPAPKKEALRFIWQFSTVSVSRFWQYQHSVTRLRFNVKATSKNNILICLVCIFIRSATKMFLVFFHSCILGFYVGRWYKCYQV